MVTRIGSSSSVSILSDRFRYCSLEDMRNFGSEEYAALYKEEFGDDALLESRTVFDVDKFANLISKLGSVKVDTTQKRKHDIFSELAYEKHRIYDLGCFREE